MSDHSNPPPPYSAKPTYDEEASRPLLAAHGAGMSAAGGIYRQPAYDQIPDDFLVCRTLYIPTFAYLHCRVQYGSTVAECALQIRMEFVRKVYSILCERLTSISAAYPKLNQTPSRSLPDRKLTIKLPLGSLPDCWSRWRRRLLPRL